MRKVLLMLFSLLVALGCAEVLLRVLHAAPEVSIIQRGRFRLSANPKIGFEPVPGFVYHGQERSFIDYEGASNSLGYRDVEHAVAKPPGVFRVVVIGDSVAAGLKVERFEDTFPPILERMLNDAGVKAEVINISVSGYNTQQEVETLREHGLQYSPDVVLVAYTLGDRERLDGGIMETLLAEKHAAGEGAGRVNPYLVKSALYRFLVFRVLGGAQHQAAPTTPAPGAHPGRDPVAPENQKDLDMISGDTVDEYLAELQRLSKQNRFEVVLAIFPYFIKSFGYYKHEDQHVFARSEGQKYGFHTLDLLETMARCREASPDTPINVDNYHPNPVGHRCAAEAMAKMIRTEILHR